MSDEPRRGGHGAEDLTGAVAVVTGAGRGIGRSCALVLSDAGALVVLVARSAEQLEAVADEIRSRGGAPHVLVADVTRYSDCAAVAEVLRALPGDLRVLVNNAGGGDVSRKLLDTEPAEWAGIVELNLTGVFNVCHAVLPEMVAAGGGRVVNIGSGAGRGATPGLSAYGAAKAGVTQLTRVLAAELWRRGIDVNEVVPGPTATAMTADMWTLGEAPPHMPSELVKSPDEVAELVLWLATRRRGGPTGQTFSLARRAL